MVIPIGVRGVKKRRRSEMKERDKLTLIKKRGGGRSRGGLSPASSRGAVGAAIY